MSWGGKVQTWGAAIGIPAVGVFEVRGCMRVRMVCSNRVIS
jgi:hypothetical protein